MTKALDLAPGPAEIFEAVRKPLGDHLGGEHLLRLGGGTALEARWHHRHSTDVDFFVEAADYKRLYQRREQLRADLERLSPQSVEIQAGFTRIILEDGGEATIGSSDAVTADPASTDTVRGTKVVLETSAEILGKKLRYRLIGNAIIVPRDLYDLAVARHYDPDALQTALGVLEQRELNDIASELRHLPYGWMENHRQPLVRPARPQDAAAAPLRVRGLFQEHLRAKGLSRDVSWER